MKKNLKILLERHSDLLNMLVRCRIKIEERQKKERKKDRKQKEERKNK